MAAASGADAVRLRQDFVPGAERAMLEREAEPVAQPLLPKSWLRRIPESFESAACQ